MRLDRRFLSWVTVLYLAQGLPYGVAHLLVVMAFSPLALSASFVDPASSTDSGMQSWELLGRWEIAAEESNPRDLRWASNDSIFLGFELGGVTERRLTEGLPIERVVIPPRNEAPLGLALLNLALSGSRLQAWAENDVASWIDTTASSSDQIRVKKMRGYFDDIDVRDDTIALLGYPTARHFSESGQSFLWLGDLRSGLDQWTPLPALREDRGEFVSTPAFGTMGMRLGSVRFLANGDLLVVPAIKPGVYRISRTGKQRASWSQETLESSLLAALGANRIASTEEPLSLEAKGPTWESGSRYIASQRFTIEDVVPIQKKGAIIVRLGQGKDAHYYLGVLDADLDWYSLPVTARATTDRIRSDYSSSNRKLVILVTHRAGKVEGPSSLFLVSTP